MSLKYSELKSGEYYYMEDRKDIVFCLKVPSFTLTNKSIIVCTGEMSGTFLSNVLEERYVPLPHPSFGKIDETIETRTIDRPYNWVHRFSDFVNNNDHKLLKQIACFSAGIFLLGLFVSSCFATQYLLMSGPDWLWWDKSQGSLHFLPILGLFIYFTSLIMGTVWTFILGAIIK